jgi:tetratricopeptide (TPR) repeat protein
MVRLSVVLLACCGCLPAQESALQQAVASYRQRNYEAAANAFTAALTEAGDPSGELLFDLGNCAYRLGHHAQAVWYFRRAQLRLPRDEEVRFNLRLAELRLGVDRPVDESLAASLRALRNAVTAEELLALALLLQGAGALGFVLLRRRRGARNAMLAIAGLGLLCWARLAQLHWLPEPPSGIVLEHRASLRASPDPRQTAVAELDAGESVEVLEERCEWLRLSHARGIGWTERANVGVVD